MPTIEVPCGIDGAAARVSDSNARALACERPVPVLVLGLERGSDDAGRRVVDEGVERAELGDLARDPLGRDVAANEHRLGASRAARRRSPRRPCRCAGSRSPPVSRRARRSAARSPARSRATRPSRGRTRPEAHRCSGRRPARRSGSSPSRAGLRLARPVLGLGRRVAEAVEQLHLLLAVAPHPWSRAGRRSAPGRARGAGRRSAASQDRRVASTSSRVGHAPKP